MEQTAQDMARYWNADVQVCREIIAASLTAQVEPLRREWASLINQLPWPVRLYVRARARLRRR